MLREKARLAQNVPVRALFLAALDFLHDRHVLFQIVIVCSDIVGGGGVTLDRLDRILGACDCQASSISHA
jgi:hypothetical protein